MRAMTRLRRTAVLAALLAGVLVGGLATPAHASSYAGNGSLVVLRMTAAINALRVAAETPSGYDRDLFPTWTDQDHDGCDTRAEVLIRTSTVPATTNQYCTVQTGRWYDWYDDTTYRSASQLDIDHLVPLAEVWASGGRRWNAARREAYANDLADPRTLVPVSLHANRSKGDQEPDEWMPIDHPCRYVRSWVVVKTRWSLAIDRAEKADLLRMATYCGNPTLRTHVATVTP